MRWRGVTIAIGMIACGGETTDTRNAPDASSGGSAGTGGAAGGSAGASACPAVASPNAECTTLGQCCEYPADPATGVCRCANQSGAAVKWTCTIDPAGCGAGGVGGSSGAGGSCPAPDCVPTNCFSYSPLECGDCLDNDGDGLVDSADPECWGACHGSEASLGLPGMPPMTDVDCHQSCFFDNRSGEGCWWSHSCDPLAAKPPYPPSGKVCAYNPQPYCAESMATQQPSCAQTCGPLTPNGCDCFGCCKLPGATQGAYLGSIDDVGNPTCTAAELDNPKKCLPCTIVESCFNPCDECELCVGKSALPASCSEQTCAIGAQKCGLPCQPACPEGQTCTAGCCVKPPQCPPPTQCPQGATPCDVGGAGCLPPCPQGQYCMSGCCGVV